MKKLFSLVLTIVMMITLIAAHADDLGVQIIGGDESSSGPISLDDIQLESSVEIPDYAEITPTYYEVRDCFVQRKSGVSYPSLTAWKSGGNGYSNVDDNNHQANIECSTCSHNKEYPFMTSDWITHNESKTQADYALLFMDVLNTTKTSRDYTGDVTVKVMFDDDVEYVGWVRQRNYDLGHYSWIAPTDNFKIDPYYTGHYVFGCTLPNAVFSSKSPLRIVITMDSNEITYNIRK